MNANHGEAPASYDDIGVGDANPEVQKCVNRIYKASGKYPWDWLPRDYVPKVAAWGTNSALNLALAVEAVHAHGSTVTMDELRDFLVRKAKERQELRKNGKPVKPTMNSDCVKARKWIEDNMVNSQSTSKHNKLKRSGRDAAFRQARPKTWRTLTIAYKKQPQDKLDDDDEDETFPEFPYDREMSVLSDISNVSSAIGPSDRRQPSIPPPPDRTSTHKRNMPPPPSPLPEKRLRQVEQFVSSNIDDFKEASRTFNPEEEACLNHGESVQLYGFNKVLRAICERIEDAEFRSSIYGQEVHNTRRNLASINMGEVRHVLQKATRDRDEKREELGQLQEELNSFTTMIDNQGGKCSETLRAMYDGFIRNCEDAKKKLENVEDTLKAMEEETQKNRRQYQDGQDKIASLEKDIAKEEEVIKWETRKKITLETLRCYVEMREKLMSASDEVLRAERDAAVKKLESLS
ncbi:hypothetical protein FOQG_13465 [Fusarium oxysporum f. sp. raphani 54005]|uniref:Uncharacterized protein n=2 Tax=Fusarium oxysporum f. sp. raphani TaxID=96318 RepID=X0BJB1_FUSOX|nr:hypothetical protein FOQG_13465 [Fusarium oxysporum f. sp. raphani 54005]KAG7425210.1 hypothetical protein Forpi1262_v013262 [Fusarium oxysporum f. sp. raphani]KAJ4032403.1 hypothetical protein NW753_013158 [Fusarium oxysporum]KAJ4038029.1 hypothetical protein NW763_013079 [Fusarium oxysporum]KAJ4085458.1 hypothetical protein NW756_008853 [Fusarium oxysporum]